MNIRTNQRSQEYLKSLFKVQQVAVTACVFYKLYKVVHVHKRLLHPRKKGGGLRHTDSSVKREPSSGLQTVVKRPKAELPQGI